MEQAPKNSDMLSQMEDQFDTAVQKALLQGAAEVSKESKYIEGSKVIIDNNQTAIVRRCEAGICLLEHIEDGKKTYTIIGENKLGLLN